MHVPSDAVHARRASRVPLALAAALCVFAASGSAVARSTATPPLLGAPSDCVSNAFCALGLRQVYGVDITKRLVPLTPGEDTYAALRDGKVSIAVGFSTDPELRDPEFVQLRDDLKMTGADNIVPLATDAIAKTYGVPLGRRLKVVTDRLTLAELRRLNAAEAEGTPPDVVAYRWVTEVGLRHGAVATKKGPPITFVAQAFPESRVLAHVYARALAADGYRTRVFTVRGYRALALDALKTGRASMTVSYAASLLEYLDRFQGFRSRHTATVLRLLRAYAAQRGLRVYAPATARNTNVFVVTREAAAELGIAELSDLKRLGYPRARTLEPPSAASVAARGDNLTNALTVGSRGVAVREAQARLDELGYKAGPPDGLYSELTRRAVAWFEQENKIEPDGVLGRATRLKLFSDSAKRPSKPLVAPGAADTFEPTGSRNVVYLTFDDGPSSYTGAVLALLKSYGMHGTFFLVGENIGLRADRVKQILREGNAVGNHTWDHTDLSKASTQSFFSEVDSTQAAIKKVTGQTTRCMRPPYGATNSSTRSLAQERGYKVVLWDVDPQDWSRPGTSSIVSNVITSTHAGSIVLMHDGGGDRSESVAALSQILANLKHRGLRSVPLDCG